LDDHYFYVDWDDAIRNARMALAAAEGADASGIPNALENSNLRTGRVFISEEDNENITGVGRRER
jgi:hypothetical protein